MKYFTTLFLLFLISCEGESIVEKRERLVVEGWVTNQDKQQWVKISTVVSFDDPRTGNPIEDAVVSIEDNVSVFPLTHSSNGLYLTNAFAGITARSYRVTIQLATGETIQSGWERMNPLMPIDIITYTFFDELDSETGENIKVYFPIVVSSDPVDETNFYRYKGFRNGELLNKSNELILLSDQFVNGATSLSHFIPEFRYSFEDTIQVELNSLTQASFQFLELLKSQTTSLESSSGVSPAALVGNLENVDDADQVVLGFFGASAVSSDTIIINQ